MRRGMLAAAVLAVSILVSSSAIAATPGRALRTDPQAHVAKHKKKKHRKKHKSKGKPSMTVVGFGINHLYVANGKTVSDAVDCSTIVQGNGYPIGPPQDVYLNAYMKAENIPDDAPTEIGEDYPQEDDEAAAQPVARDALGLSAPVPWSQVFDKSSLGFGTPPGSQADIYRGALFSYDDADGPSASDFDGTYTFEVSVEVNGTTLDSTATATINC
jgi:hypothetical protein